MNLLLEIQSLRVKLFTYEEGPDQVFFFGVGDVVGEGGCVVFGV